MKIYEVSWGCFDELNGELFFTSKKKAEKLFDSKFEQWNYSKESSKKPFRKNRHKNYETWAMVREIEVDTQ